MKPTQSSPNSLAYRILELKRKWAPAMVDRYGGVPAEAQWSDDPIVRRLRSSRAEQLHNDMIRLAVETMEKRAKQ